MIEAKTVREPVQVYKTDLVCVECNVVMEPYYSDDSYMCPRCEGTTIAVSQNGYPEFDYEPLYPHND